MMSKEELVKLTEEQKELLPMYRDKGIEIGFSVHDPDNFPTEKIHELINAHRKMCGVPETKDLYLAESPYQVVAKLGKTGVSVSNALYGNHDIHWLQFYSFFRHECELTEQTEKIKYLLELTKYVGWMWMCSEYSIICKKPVEIHTIPGKIANDHGEFDSPILHNLDGMSQKYADGMGTYHLWGTRIPDDLSWVITTPAEELDMKKVMRIKDTDIKSLVLKKIGINRAFEKLDKQIIHEKTFQIGGEYMLFEVDFGNGPERYLKMQCPSKKDYHIEGVARECETVDQARGWRTYHTAWNQPGFVYPEPEVQT